MRATLHNQVPQTVAHLMKSSYTDSVDVIGVARIAKITLGLITWLTQQDHPCYSASGIDDGQSSGHLSISRTETSSDV
jgi:hypothetical protein